MCSQDDDPSQHDVLRTANYAPGFVPTQKIDDLIAERDALIRERDVLRELLREAIHEVHVTGSIRDHADPNDRTGWHVKGIETCADLLCVEARAVLP